MTNQTSTQTFTKEEIHAKIHENRGLSPMRKLADGVKNLFTYLSALLAVFVLGSVFVFVFSRGWNTLSFDLITSGYHTENLMVNFTEDAVPKEFAIPEDIKEGEFYSTRYGFAVVDDKDASHRATLIVTRIEEDSPLNNAAVNAIAGETEGQEQKVNVGMNLSRLGYKTAEDKSKSTGSTRKHDAKEMVELLDSEAASLETLTYTSAGGGFRGSLIATLMVIGMTLLIALPIGIFAAIYLHEVAKKNKLTDLIRSSIEMLNGVPSIIFGLMGVAVFFPLTAAFGATTPNVLLGAITMTVVLLPVIIRQTEEALITVPDKMRMGSLALGATKTQTIFKVVLPNALPGILTAALLSISRIIGESAALIYTMGTFVVDDPQLTGRATTLAVQIWSVMSGEQPNFELASAISIVVLVMVLILNITIKIITSNLNKKWKE